MLQSVTIPLLTRISQSKINSLITPQYFHFSKLINKLVNVAADCRKLYKGIVIDAANCRKLYKGIVIGAANCRKLYKGLAIDAADCRELYKGIVNVAAGCRSKKYTFTSLPYLLLTIFHR